MSDVPVTRKNVLALTTSQALQKRHERVQKPELRRLALGPRGTGRQIERHHGQLAEACLEITPLAVELVDAEPADDFFGFLAAVKRRTRITRPLGIEEVALVAGEFDVVPRKLRSVRLGLLQADDVRVLAAQPLEGTLRGGRTYAIRILR